MTKGIIPGSTSDDSAPEKPSVLLRRGMKHYLYDSKTSIKHPHRRLLELRKSHYVKGNTFSRQCTSYAHGQAMLLPEPSPQCCLTKESRRFKHTPWALHPEEGRAVPRKGKRSHLVICCAGAGVSRVSHQQSVSNVKRMHHEEEHDALEHIADGVAEDEGESQHDGRNSEPHFIDVNLRPKMQPRNGRGDTRGQ